MADVHIIVFMDAINYDYKSADKTIMIIIPAIIIIIFPGCGEKAIAPYKWGSFAKVQIE